MPNLQHWLNAWVKVNSKQGNTSMTTSANNNSSHHSSHHSLGGSKSHHRHDKAVPVTSTRTSSTIRTGPASSSSAESLVAVGASATAATEKRRSGAAPSNSPLDTLTRSATGSSSSAIMFQLEDSLANTGIGSQNHHNGVRDNQSMSSNEPLVVDPEQEAIRKFNSRKHKRRLHRTNSFSDLIRQKALHRPSRTGRRYSVERQHYTGESKASQGGPERRSSRSRRTSTTTSSSNQRQRYLIPPPETLHHPMIPLPPPEDLSSESSCSCPSVSASPSTATTSTIMRSNLHEYTIDHRTADEHSVDSNSVLFGVADFFGHEIPEMRVRASNSTTTSRYQTHQAQHGLEDEQPHYLRAYMDEQSSTSHHPDPQPPQQQQQPYPHSNRHASKKDTTNNNNTTRLNPQHLHQHSSLYDTARPPHTQLHHHREQPRKANFAHPQPTIPLRQNAQKTDADSSAARNVSPPKQQLDKQTESSSATGLLVGGIRLPFFSSNNTVETAGNNKEGTTTNGNKKKNDSNPFGVGKHNCAGCQIAQAELRHTQESLEYMRTMAIRKEFTCCKCGSSATTNSEGTGNARRSNSKRAPVVKNSSQQLLEVTGRHKKQVEQLMKERNHWQRNMHLKLEKFANLCHNLNDESSQRVEESQSLKEELETIRAERDRMASELVPLKASVEEFEKEREEHRLLKERMALYEKEGLRQADEAIAKRDDLIAKLSSRLETTLDTLAVEREQQRQRRQIIFPLTQKVRNGHYQTNAKAVTGDATQTSSTMTTTTSNSSLDNSQQEELKRLRAELEEAQRNLKATQLEAQQNEKELLSRCETLENQLNTNGATDSATSKNETEEDC